MFDEHSSKSSSLCKSSNLSCSKPTKTSSACSLIKELTIKYFQTHSQLYKTDLNIYLIKVGLDKDWSTEEEKNCLWEYFTKSNIDQQYTDLESVLSVIDYIFSENNGDISIDYDIFVNQSGCSSLHISQLNDTKRLGSMDYDAVIQTSHYSNIEKYINIIHSKSFLVSLKLINEILLHEHKDNGTVILNINEFHIRMKESFRFIIITKKEFEKYMKVLSILDTNNIIDIDKDVLKYVNKLLNEKLLTNVMNENDIHINYSEGNFNKNCELSQHISYKNIVDNLKYYDQICYDFINAINDFKTNINIFTILINSFINFLKCKNSFYENILSSNIDPFHFIPHKHSFSSHNLPEYSISEISQNKKVYSNHHRKCLSLPNNIFPPSHLHNNTFKQQHQNNVQYDSHIHIDSKIDFDESRKRSNTKVEKKKKRKFQSKNNTIITDDISRKESTFAKLEEYTFSNDDMFSKADITEKCLFETTQMNETNMLINEDIDNKKIKRIFYSNYSLQGENDDDKEENDSLKEQEDIINTSVNIISNEYPISNIMNYNPTKKIYLNNYNPIKEEEDEYNLKSDSTRYSHVNSISKKDSVNNQQYNNITLGLSTFNKTNLECWFNMEQLQTVKERENYLLQDLGKGSPFRYYYDFLSLHKHQSIRKILSIKGDVVSPGELFSDDMFFMNDKYKFKRIQLVITSSSFYLFKRDYNEHYYLYKFLKRIYLKHIVFSSSNNNIIIFTFQGQLNPDFVFITFKRLELFLYLRDLYQSKVFGNMRCYNMDECEEFQELFRKKNKSYKKHLLNADKMFRVPTFENSIKSGFLLVYYKNFFSCSFYEKYVVLSPIGLMLFDEPYKIPEIIIPLTNCQLRNRRIVMFQQKSIFCFKLTLPCQPIKSFLFGSRNSQECEMWRTKINYILNLDKLKMKNFNSIIQCLNVQISNNNNI